MTGATTSNLILGGGVTGLAAGAASGAAVFEATDRPGGICSSYYMRPGTDERLAAAPPESDAFRFEHGGGHWIFGGDDEVLRLIERLTPLRRYERRSSVYFAASGKSAPYPIQNHLRYLGETTAEKALKEILEASGKSPSTMGPSSPPRRTRRCGAHRSRCVSDVPARSSSCRGCRPRRTPPP